MFRIEDLVKGTESRNAHSREPILDFVALRKRKAKTMVTEAWKNLYGAVSGMVVSDKCLRERLADAMRYHLAHIRPDDIPDPELRLKFAEIYCGLGATIPAHPHDSTAEACTRQLADGDAHEIAGRIFELFLALDALKRKE